ncbi:MAG: BMP family ABC transporter substrate-binding protein [Candidatus Dormibacteraceae bacterium]
MTVAYVSDVGGLNDKGYNQYTYLGMKEGAQKVGAKLDVIETQSPSDYVANITTAAREASLVVVSGFSMGDALAQVAKQFPKVKFAILDYSYTKKYPNVQGDIFDANQSSYLGGIVAAGISKTHTVGFVGGVQSPLLEQFLGGYEAGALAYDPHTHVKVAWTGSFTDQNAGKQSALAEIAQHADVIYTAAGASGLGGIAAAQQSHVWAIGVDNDQNSVAPSTVVTSVVKELTVVASDNVEGASKGSWKSGTKTFDLANNGVGLASYHGLSSVVPAAVKAAVVKAKQQLISGAVKAPNTPQYPNGN